jgi:hypothetical protein
MKKTKTLLLGLLTMNLAYGQTDKPTRTTTAPSHPVQKIQTFTPQQEFDLGKQSAKDAIPKSSFSTSNLS